MNRNKLIIVICIIGALACAYISFQEKKNPPAPKALPVEQQITETNNTEQKVFVNGVAQKYKNGKNTNIAVNYPVSLSYLTKEKIYGIRKRYVAQSIFENPNYEPSEFVFGQIESGKPWMRATVCGRMENGKYDINGVSEESRFINNPTVLVALEYPFSVTNPNYPDCDSAQAIMLPKSVSYNGETNEITVVYSNLPVVIQNNSFYQFNGINAKDFGYDYFYLDKSKSTYQPEFFSNDNPSERVMQFQNFLHLGSSCGHEGGCNNGSPRQPALEFTYISPQFTRQNVKLYLKLWKNPPSSPDAPADINEIIVIEKI